jgi:hypothetical protein
VASGVDPTDTHESAEARNRIIGWPVRQAAPLLLPAGATLVLVTPVLGASDHTGLQITGMVVDRDGDLEKPSPPTKPQMAWTPEKAMA